jgi:F-type H+-transporting ATPase subunit alpha
MNLNILPKLGAMTDKTVDRTSILEKRSQVIADYRFSLNIREKGTVVSVGDGIVWIEGLPSAAIDEILTFGDGSRAMAFQLTEKLVGAVLLEETPQLSAGEKAYHSGRLLTIPVGDQLLGRIIDPLGYPLDGSPLPEPAQFASLDMTSPPLMTRDFVNRPLHTGNIILDALIPIGKGQRQLFIGDNGMGKSSLAIDTILNQRGKDVLCIYVLIGQKRSSVLDLTTTLQERGALDYTTVVVAEATALPGLKYLAPYAGCAIAEYWMNACRDTLIVYDDLTTHAKSYREMSLLLRRPPGREAYPADIFFLHSRLLERSTCLATQLGGGSMTALPIIETEEGELTAYIPTNLISITDGQTVFSDRLFSAGFLPAIDITRSVSRIGGKAQEDIVKQEASRMKLDYLQFLELEAFTRFGAKLEAATERKLRRGRILRELLKQDRFSPFASGFQLALLIAFNRGWLDSLEPAQVAEAKAKLSQSYPQINLDPKQTKDELHRTIDTWCQGVLKNAKAP